MKKQFVIIDDAGVDILSGVNFTNPNLPASPSARPVSVAVHRGPLLELMGENFSVSTKLSIEDALNLITQLSFATREASGKGCMGQFAEVSS